MDNLKSPAYPHRSNSLEGGHTDPGFTKLEKAALMIAQGLLAGDTEERLNKDSIIKLSVEYAKAVLEEANQ